MTGVNDLLESERGVFSILLVVAVTGLAIAKIISGQEWLTFAKWIAVTLVASKTVTGAIETLVKPADAPAASSPPAGS